MIALMAFVTETCIDATTVSTGMHACVLQNSVEMENAHVSFCPMPDQEMA